MGFVTGFTGGVTLTLSIAYLSALAHQRNREAQSQSLRAQALAIRSVIHPQPPPLPPTRSEAAAAQRDASLEVAKDRWNAEVLNAVRWVQNTDWSEVRQDTEDRVVTLWSQLFGEAAEAAEGGEKKAAKEAKPIARRAKAAVEQTGSDITTAAKEAFVQAKEKAEKIELSAEDAALDARLRATKSVQQKAEEAGGVISSALKKGKETAKAAVGKAKTAVGLASAQVEDMTGAKVGESKLTPVQQALQARYDSQKETRTVEEVLNERYLPVDGNSAQ